VLPAGGSSIAAQVDRLEDDGVATAAERRLEDVPIAQDTACSRSSRGFIRAGGRRPFRSRAGRIAARRDAG
jgi:hypothetical protein